MEKARRWVAIVSGVLILFQVNSYHKREEWDALLGVVLLYGRWCAQQCELVPVVQIGQIVDEAEGLGISAHISSTAIGPTRPGRSSQSRGVGKIVSRIGKAADVIVEEPDERTERPIKYASAHDLRRSCGDRLRNAGVPPLVICRVMQHESRETTRNHYAPGDVMSDLNDAGRYVPRYTPNLEST